MMGEFLLYPFPGRPEGGKGWVGSGPLGPPDIPIGEDFEQGTII